MTTKKTEKRSWYRKIFNMLIGEDYLSCAPLLAIGLLIGVVGFLSMNTWSKIDDIVQFQIFVTITLGYILVYFYIGFKYIKAILPAIAYYSMAIMYLWFDLTYDFSYYLLVGLIFFALLDELGVYLQRRKAK